MNKILKKIYTYFMCNQSNGGPTPLGAKSSRNPCKKWNIFFELFWSYQMSPLKSKTEFCIIKKKKKSKVPDC